VEPPSHPLKPREIKDVNVALVLGGGGVKGIAHLGVIEVLEKNGIPIDLIVGTSAGSIIGALYANYQDSTLLHENLIHLHKWDILDISIINTFRFFSALHGPIQGYYLEEFMVKNTTVNNIEELKIPFVAVATDLNCEKAFRISSGPIATAIHASSALPPYFSPIKAYGKILVDGGVVEPVPVPTAKLYNPKVIIAVDISTSGREYTLSTMWDVTNRSLYVSYYTLSQFLAKQADVFIHPPLEGYGTFDDGNNHKLYRIGKRAAIDKLPDILHALAINGIPRFSQNKPLTLSSPTYADNPS
jgi:NTE family protein